MKDLMTECAECEERHENVIQMFSPLMRHVERLSDEMEKMVAIVGRQSDDMQKMVVTVGRTTDTTEKLVGWVDRYARLCEEDEGEIEDCTICGEPSKEELCEECTHEQFAWKDGDEHCLRPRVVHSFLSSLVKWRPSLEH